MQEQDVEIKPLEPGATAPDFVLEDILSGVDVGLAELNGQIIVLDFWSCECPWSRHYDEYFADRAEVWESGGIQLLHVKSNLNETPSEADNLALKFGVNAPILNDVDGALAREYGAQVTPHVFVITEGRKIAYQGAIDDRSFRQHEPTINYLDQAIEAVRAHQQPDPAQTPAYGCAIVREMYEK